MKDIWVFEPALFIILAIIMGITNLAFFPHGGFASITGYTMFDGSQVHRSFSPSPVNGLQNLTVNITIKNSGNHTYYAIEEYIPFNWTIVNNGGGGTPNGSILKWYYISNVTAAPNITHRYVVRAPNSAKTYSFSGLYQIEDMTNSSATEGSTSVSVSYSDVSGPVVKQISPKNNNVTKSNSIIFRFNATDQSNIKNCSLLINKKTNLTNTSITKIVQQTFRKTLSNAKYNWSITCYDQYNNKGNSSTFGLTMNLSVDMTPPATTLNRPRAGYFNDSTPTVIAIFNCSATDNQGLSNISLFMTTRLGTLFRLNQTRTAHGKWNSSKWSVNLGLGNYIWNCRSYDSAGNLAWATNRTLKLNFTPDITPPIRSNGQPSGALNTNTVITSLSLTTDENAICRYTNSSGVGYISMTRNFSTTGAKSHSVTLSGLQNGHSYFYYVRCKDSSNNTNNNDYAINFSISSAPDITAPTRFNGKPSNELAAGTTSTLLGLNTNENATCRYSLVQGQVMTSMTPFTATGKTSHNSTISGLQNNTRYTYYVKCKDKSNNTNNDDYSINFSVARTTDPFLPTVLLLSPADASTITSSQVVNLTFNVTDLHSIDNCTLFIDSTASQTTTSVTKGIGQSFSILVQNGQHSWQVQCYDQNENLGASTIFSLVMAYVVPSSCGDSICNNGETCTSCLQDCGACSSGGGGGGGGGGGSPPAKMNPDQRSRTWYSMTAHQSTNWDITNFTITELALEPKVNANAPKIVITRYEERPLSLPYLASSYMFLNISHDNLDVANAQITFKVPTVFAKNHVVSLYRLRSDWYELPTAHIKDEAGYSIYQAASNGLSFYAVVITEPAPVSQPTPVATTPVNTVTTQPVSTPASTEVPQAIVQKQKQEHYILYSIIIFVAIVAAFLTTRIGKLFVKSNAGFSNSYENQLQSELNKYINTARQKGFNDADIKNKLLSSGWPSDRIDSALMHRK